MIPLWSGLGKTNRKANPAGSEVEGETPEALSRVQVKESKGLEFKWDVHRFFASFSLLRFAILANINPSLDVFCYSRSDLYLCGRVMVYAPYFTLF